MTYMKHIHADAVIIGGGAAGSFCAAITSDSGMQIVILEPNNQLGRKLRITGKGRCNLTNNCDARTVMSNIPGKGKFLYSALTMFPPERTMSYFESLGIALKTERGNRVFPVSDNANDIADALANRLITNKVLVIHERASDIVINNQSVYQVLSKTYIIDTEQVVIATGGKTYPKTGSSGDGYAFAKKLGHKVTTPKPSLVPLESNDPVCLHLQGLSLKNVELTARENNSIIYQDRGEMIFTHFGISGPLVLSASAHMRNFPHSNYNVIIDLKPALDDATLDNRILRDFNKYKNKAIRNGLTDLLPHALIPVILSRAGIPGGKPIHEITKIERKQLIHNIKRFTISITGTRPFDEAIITAGGVETDEINPRTMESKFINGLYFSGEILDLDAYTGGYNLQIAWSTAFLAAESIKKHKGKV